MITQEAIAEAHEPLGHRSHRLHLRPGTLVGPLLRREFARGLARDLGIPALRREPSRRAPLRILPPDAARPRTALPHAHRLRRQHGTRAGRTGLRYTLLGRTRDDAAGERSTSAAKFSDLTTRRCHDRAARRSGQPQISTTFRRRSGRKQRRIFPSAASRQPCAATRKRIPRNTSERI